MNIYEKINTIMSEVKSLQKDGKVAYGNTKYNYLSEAKTTEIFREKLIKHKLVLLPIKVTDEKDGQITKGHYIYRLINAEKPEEYIDLETTGQGHDSADKGSGKASSYAYKYLMWRTFAIPSNDDPDQVSSDEIKEQHELANKKIDSIKLKAIEQAIDAKKEKITADMICTHYKIKTLSNLNLEQWTDAMKRIEKVK